MLRRIFVSTADLQKREQLIGPRRNVSRYRASVYVCVYEYQVDSCSRLDEIVFHAEIGVWMTSRRRRPAGRVRNAN